MLYRNCLGMLEAVADIDAIGYKSDEYVLHTLIKGYPDKRWSTDTPIEDIVHEMEDSGFAVEIGRDGYNNYRLRCIHRETQAAIDAAKNAENKKFANVSRGYVRFGDLPEGGRSRNHRDNALEAGVSCFEAEFAPDGDYRLRLPTPALEVSVLTLLDRPVYRVYGEVVGTGADGEPLLRVEKMESIGSDEQ